MEFRRVLFRSDLLHRATGKHAGARQRRGRIPDLVVGRRGFANLERRGGAAGGGTAADRPGTVVAGGRYAAGTRDDDALPILEAVRDGGRNRGDILGAAGPMGDLADAD